MAQNTLSQSCVAKMLVLLRCSCDGWTTIKQLHTKIGPEIREREVRKRINRMILYNMLEIRAIDARTREFRIKDLYIDNKCNSYTKCERANTNRTHFDEGFTACAELGGQKDG